MSKTLQNSALIALLVGILVVLISYSYSKWILDSAISPEALQLEIESISKAWDILIRAPSIRFTKVAVGLNTNVDLIVSGTALLKAMKIKPDKKANHEVLQNLLDLQETFHYFFARSSAAERFFSDGSLFDYLTDTASELNDAEWYIGGNAALMAQTIASTFSNKITEVMLIGPIGPRLRKLLHPDMIIPDNIIREEDEVHLIMEYKQKEIWGKSEAPRANRFITSHDMSNSQMEMLNSFIENVNQFEPNLIILSGLHLLDGQLRADWEAKLQSIVQKVKSLPDKIPLHLELASMMDKDLVYYIITQVLPHVTSMGLNEQELAFLAFVGDGPEADMFNSDEKFPDIYKIVNIMSWLLMTFGEGSKFSHSKLSRIHFHSLGYHIVATSSKKWLNLDSSVAAGARISSQQACNTTTFDVSKLELRIPRTLCLTESKKLHFNASEPVIRWQDQGITFVFSPVLICKAPLKTVGLGDAISATGLLFTEFSPN